MQRRVDTSTRTDVPFADAQAMGCAAFAVTKYGFNPSWRNEQRRLALIERCWDPATTERLAAAGVGPGWNYLEVGAGNGSIARWLRDRVGAGGKVVAFDLDRFFADEPGIEVRQGDILSDHLERDAYDLVHCRALLHHLPGRQHEALQRMAAALRPGGVLVATEPWLGAMWASPTDAYARASKAVDAANTC
jgi:SAM-dependent methyltransferase